MEGLLAGESLDPVARIVTTRTAYRLLNADGELVLEIADDQVQSGPPDGESMLHSWREVEVELGPAGKKKDLKRAREAAAGCRRVPEHHAGTSSTALSAPRCRIGQASTVESGTVGELVGRVPGERSAMCSPATTSECAPVRRRCTRPGWRRVGYAARCGSLPMSSTPHQLRSWTTS